MLAEEVVTRVRTALDRAKQCINRAQQEQAEYANRSRKEVEFQRGDKVLLSTRYLSRRDEAGRRKLDRLWAGPFTVTERIGKVSYRLALPTDMRMHDVFHVSLLRAFRESSSFPGREVPKVLTYVPEHVERQWFTVSCFLDRRKQGRTVQFKVRWDGYTEPDSETWEPESALRRDLGAETFKALVADMERNQLTASQVVEPSKPSGVSQQKALAQPIAQPVAKLVPRRSSRRLT